MGMGKSLIVLNAIDTLILCGFQGKFLVIAPLRVAKSTWADETKKWSHLAYLKVSAIVGTPKERLAALSAEADIYTVNFENLPWMVEQLNGKWPFRMVVADESTKLKSHRAHFRQKKDGTQSLVCSGGVRTNAIARLAFTKTLRWVNLTGTPASQGLMDLYGPQWFVDKGASLGSSYTAFTDRWYKKGYDGFSLTMLPQAEKEIRDLIAPTTFTLRAEDYLTLPTEITNTILVDMPPAARKLYSDMERKLFIEIEAGEVEAFSAAARSAKLHQLANGAVYYDKNGSFECTHDAKIDALKSVIEEAAGTPVIVVYNYKSDLARLKKAFPKGKQLDKNVKTLYDFNSGNIPILFLHPASAGHGIDGMQNATNIICFFSVDFNLELRSQAVARIGAVRQCQANTGKTTIIHQLICRDSIDEDILDRIESKKSVEEALKAGLARRNLK
jgi:SNF2 family DNA or RNA helicase